MRQVNQAPHVPLTPELNLTDPLSLDTPRTICDQLMLREALGRLTLEQQQVVTLKFFAGLSNSEIAATLNRTEGAVKALQHRAIIRLQSILMGNILTSLGSVECRN
jgi:RNA polymerase sigma-70 factor (ECF subfamily)